MATDSVRVSAKFPVSPERLYRAWLDGAEHGKFLGGTASIEPVVGGRFMAWDDYITGMILQLDAMRRVVQTWRTTEFPDDAPDSRLEVLFEPEGDGTRVTLIHTDIPAGDGEKYEDGWIDYYFEPMQRYFKRIAIEESKPHAIAPAASKIKIAVKAKIAKAAKPKRKTSPKKVAPMKRVKAKVKKLAKKIAAKRVVRKAARKKAARKRAVRRKVIKKRVVRRVVRGVIRRKVRRAVRKAVRSSAKQKTARGRAKRK